MSTVGNSLKRLTYRPELLKPIQKLGLSSVLRRAYFLAVAPAGKVRISVAGVSGYFRVRDASELRRIEGPTSSRSVSSSEMDSLRLLIRSVRPGDIVFDIGANVGLYSILLAKAVGPTGRVFAFEPDKRNRTRLGENTRLNGLENIRVFPKALGEGNYRASLYVRNNDPCQSSLAACQASGGQLEEIVDVVNGDGFRMERSLPVPRVVKIDVEGYEHNVIKGLRHTLAEPACHLVCCEIHPHLLKDTTPQEILESLRSLGFTRVNVSQRGLVQYAVASKN